MAAHLKERVLLRCRINYWLHVVNVTKKEKIRILFVHDGESYTRREEGIDHQEYLQYTIDRGLDDDTEYEVRLVTDPRQAMYYSLEASRWDVLVVHANLGHDLSREDSIRFGPELLIRRFIDNNEWTRVIVVSGAGLSGEDELAKQWGANNSCCEDEILYLFSQIIRDHKSLKLTPEELGYRFLKIVEITDTEEWRRKQRLRMSQYEILRERDPPPPGTSLKRSPEGD